MNKTIILLGTIILIVSFSTLAEAGSNLIGLYFDEAGSDNCHLDGLFEVVPVYLILKSPSNSVGVGGWQGTLYYDEGIFVAGYTLAGQTINVGSGDSFIVGLGNPLPSAETVILAEFNLMATAAGGIRFNALEGDSAAQPLYLAGDDYATLIPMYHEYGGGSQPSLTIGLEDCPEDNQAGSVSTDSDRSWGGIKALYQ